MPAAADDCALWRIRHMDGDEEDLEEAELFEALRLMKEDEEENTREAEEEHDKYE